MTIRARDWLDALPPSLAEHRALLAGLLEAAERDERWRWLELGCSVAEGRGDALSDLDLGLGVDPDAWPGALEDLPALLRDLGPVVDMLHHRIPEWGSIPHQRTWVQYASGVQIDLVAVPAGPRKERHPQSVVLYDADGQGVEPWGPEVLRADAESVREWTMLGWAALADLAKYLARGSLWEALERLQGARAQVWRPWATAQGLRYPLYGMTEVLDHPEVGIPDGIEGTVASLDSADLRRAALACADVLHQTSRDASARFGISPPDDLAAFVRLRLEGAENRDS